MFFVMISKIKQNILPILTFIVVIISAICLVSIISPRPNKAFTIDEDSEWSVTVGDYLYYWRYKDEKGKFNSYNPSYNFQTWLPGKIVVKDENGNSFYAYCISPRVNNGTQYLTNCTVSQDKSSPYAKYLASGQDWYAIQSAIRLYTDGGGFNTKVMQVNGKAVSPVFVYKDQNTKISTATNINNFKTAFFNTNTNISGSFSGAKPQQHIYTETEREKYKIKRNDGKYWVPLFRLNNTGSRTSVSYSLSFSGVPSVTKVEGSDASNGIRNGKINYSGKNYTAKAGKVYIFWAPVTSQECSITLDGTYMGGSTFSVYRVNSGGQDFVFGYPETSSNRFHINTTWKKTDTSITITKKGTTVAKPAGFPLSGVVFGLYKGNQLIETKTTDSNGKATWDNLSIGTNYTIKEIKGADDYDIDSTLSKGYTFTAKDPPVPVTFTNSKKKGGWGFDKQFFWSFDTSHLYPISGVTNNLSFYLLDSNGKKYSMQKNGNRYTINNLEYGTYTLWETGTASYNGKVVIDYSSQAHQIMKNGSPYKVVINGDNANAANKINNSMSTGEFELTKYEQYSANSPSTGKLLAGAKFRLTMGGTTINVTGSAGNYTYAPSGGSSELITGANGKLTVKGLPPGNYVITETQAPNVGGIQYKILNQSGLNVTITANNKSTLSVGNAPERGDLDFYKKDALDNSPYTSAIFVLRKGTSGYVILNGSNGNYQMPETPVFSSSSQGATQIHTDSNGYCKITNLVVGDTYYIEEINSGSIYYSIDNTTLNGSLRANTTTPFGTFKNTPITKSFTIHKIGPWNETVNDATFILYRDGQPVNLTGSNGNYKFSSVGGSGTNFSTNNGNVTVSGLIVGRKVNGVDTPYVYTVKEISTSTMYTVSSSTLTINFNGQNSFKNDKKSGGVLIKKTSEYNSDVILAGAKFTLTYLNDGSQSNLTNKPVNAIGNGPYTFKDYSSATTFITNSQGMIDISGLPYGNYRLTEIAAPTNYQLPAKNTYDFTIDDAHKKPELRGDIIKQTPLINRPSTGSFEFSKVGNINGEVIADCLFNIQCIESAPLGVSTNGTPKYLTFNGTAGNYILEDSNYKNSNTSPNGASFEIRTDNQGHCKVDGLPVGKYRITEKGCSNTNSEYVLIKGNQSGINYTLTLKSNFEMSLQGGKVALVADAEVKQNSKILVNTRKTGNLEFTKLDDSTNSTNSRLSSCKFVIKMLDREIYMTFNGENGNYTYNGVATSVDTATKFNVDTNGKAVFKNLPIGTYEIQEISADADNIFKLNTTPVQVKVLADADAKISMSNTPWGGKLTFIKKTEHGTYYPNCDKECEFILKATEGANKGKFAVLKLDPNTKYYQFASFVQNQSDATKIVTNLTVTDNKNRSAVAKAVIFDIPVGTYQIIETKTGSNYDLAKSVPTEYKISLLRDQVEKEKLDANTGLVKEMTNYVLKSKTILLKEMADSVLPINGKEEQISSSGFKASITGTSVTSAPISIKYISDDKGHFNITEYTIDGVQQKLTDNSYVELPFGDYVISEYDITSHAKYGEHVHLDSITKSSGESSISVWDRVKDTKPGSSQSITHKCTSSDAVTFKFTNILDNPDLTVIKSNGATPQNKDSSTALAFIDTDIVYNVSGISNEYDTHNADITITDYPEKERMANDSYDSKLAIRSIVIPGYKKIENGSDAISYSVNIYGRNNEVLKSIPKTKLTAENISIDDLSPNVDTSDTDFGMCNIDRIEIVYYNFPARSKMDKDAAIIYKFRLGGDLTNYQSSEKNPVTGKALFKTYNDVELRHSFMTKIAKDDASTPIKKVNIQKLNINKLINSIVNGVDYSKNNYDFNPDYTSFKFEVAGVLINEDDQWESYKDVAVLESNAKVEMAIPYGVYRLQELHTDGYNDQIGYNLMVDSNGVFIGEQTDGLDYIDWSDATNVTGKAKILNYKNMSISLDDTGVYSSISPKPNGLEKLKAISTKSYIQKVEKTITNTLSTGILTLDKNTTVFGGDGNEALSKEGYHLTLKGTSYSGVTFEFNLISDKDGKFVPDGTTIQGFNKENSSYRIPDGKYTLSEHSLPDLVVADNIVYNGEKIWSRENDVEDASTTNISTNIIVEKDPTENKGIITNTTNTKVYDEYELTELQFNKLFVGNSRKATKEDFERIALDDLAEYNFRITLTNQDTKLKYTGLLNSKNGISFYNLPFGTYLFEENSEMLFTNTSLEILSGAHNVTLEKKDGKYFITLNKVPNDSEAIANFNVSNKLSDFRGYASVDSVPNLITGDKSNTKSVLTVTVTDFNDKLLSSAAIEIYAENDLNNPINFKLIDGQITYAPIVADGTFTTVEIGETGYAKIYGIPDGKYIIKQTKTADGYKVVRTNSPVIIKKDNGGSDIFLYQALIKD